MRRLLAIILVVCCVGCFNPFEKEGRESPYPPEAPPFHPDHDINKPPHEWEDNASSIERIRISPPEQASVERSEGNAAEFAKPKSATGND